MSDLVTHGTRFDDHRGQRALTLEGSAAIIASDHPDVVAVVA